METARTGKHRLTAARSRFALLLLLAATLPLAHAGSALSGAFLSAGLTEALRDLANAADNSIVLPQPPMWGAGQLSDPPFTGFAALPLWSLELFGAGGDPGQPAVLRSSDDGTAAKFTVSDASEAADPSHIQLVFARVNDINGPLLTFDLRSADGAALAAGNYPGATAAVTAGAPQLDIFYNVDHCHASERGFVIDEIAFFAGKLSKLLAHFHCGASFSGVLRYNLTAATGDDVVHIRGVAWRDQNADGQRDYDTANGRGDDSPFGGVQVFLRRDGRRVANTLTQENGEYAFTAPYGTYQVEVVPPADMIVTVRDTGGASMIDAQTNLSDPIVPGPADVEMIIRADEFPPGTVPPATVPHVALEPTLPIGLAIPGGRPSLPLASTRLAPLKSGDRTRYTHYDGLSALATEVVLPKRQRLDGSVVFDVEDSDTNHLFLSNDGQGLRLHRADIKLNNGRRSGVKFEPAMVLLPPLVDVVPHRSSGRAKVRNAAGVVTSLRYVLNTNFAAGFGGVPQQVADIDPYFGGGRGVYATSTLSFSGRASAARLAATTHGYDIYRLDDGLAYSRLPGLNRQHDLSGRQYGFGDSFDANRRSDVVAWDEAEKHAGVWQMVGTAAPLWQDLPAASSGAATIVKGDFDDDGQLDIATHEIDSGLVSLSDGTAPPIPKGFAAPGSTLIGRGGFSASGRGFLMWRNPGHVGVGHWSFYGPSYNAVVSDIVDRSDTPLPVPASWRLVGSGDFNADGMDEVVWEDPASGRCEIWFVNFSMRMRVASKSLPAPWRVAAVDDFDGDGRADFLWRNSRTRELRLWLMEGTKVVSDSIIATGDAGMRVIDSGDFNGDGAADLLWRDGASSEFKVWLLNGARVLSRGDAQSLPAGFTPVR